MNHRAPLTFVLALACGSLSGCLFGSSDLPTEAPPLASLQEPPALLVEPADELARAALDPGAFSGLEVTDARASLDALLGEPEGLAVSRVVENSPAAQAGIVSGDVLLDARVLPDGQPRELAWPSEWRELELNCKPGTRLEVNLERAGTILQAQVELVPRFRPAERVAVARLREDQRAGIVVRAATEVEARAANLGPGAGAVIVGLSGDSPWRKVDLRFEDLIVAVDGEHIAAPDVLIDRIRGAKQGARLELDLRRAGQPLHVSAPLSQREQELTEFSIPLLFSYERTRRNSETSFLFGLFNFERTPVAWKFRLFWLIKFAGGDSERLEEVGS